MWRSISLPSLTRRQKQGPFGRVLRISPVNCIPPFPRPVDSCVLWNHQSVSLRWVSVLLNWSYSVFVHTHTLCNLTKISQTEIHQNPTTQDGSIPAHPRWDIGTCSLLGPLSHDCHPNQWWLILNSQDLTRSPTRLSTMKGSPPIRPALKRGWCCSG